MVIIEASMADIPSLTLAPLGSRVLGSGSKELTAVSSDQDIDPQPSTLNISNPEPSTLNL